MANYLTTLILTLFCIMFVAYGFGLTSDISGWTGFTNFTTELSRPNTNQTDIIEILVNSWWHSEISVVGIVTTGTLFIASGGALAPYLVATFLLSTIAAWFFYPYGLIASFGLPVLFNWFFAGFISLWLALAIMGFISGRDT